MTITTWRHTKPLGLWRRVCCSEFESLATESVHRNAFKTPLPRHLYAHERQPLRLKL